MTTVAHSVASEAVKINEAAAAQQLQAYREICARMIDVGRQEGDSEKLATIMADLELTYNDLVGDTEALKAKRNLEAAQSTVNEDLAKHESTAELRAAIDAAVQARYEGQELLDKAVNDAMIALSAREQVEARQRSLRDKLYTIRQRAPRLFD